MTFNSLRQQATWAKVGLNTVPDAVGHGIRHDCPAKNCHRFAAISPVWGPQTGISIEISAKSEF